MPDNFFYRDIAADLESKNKPKLHQYFYAQNFVPEDGTQPFGGILPLTDQFFGPKNLTLLILSKPYRSSDDLIKLAAEKIKQTYKIWTRYEVKIWIDMVLAQRMADEGDPSFYTDMEEFAGKVEAFCNELKDFGMSYMGTLTDGKDAAFFQTYIDEFYATEKEGPTRV